MIVTGDQQHSFVQHVIKLEVMGQCQWYAFGHTTEHDRGAGNAKWRLSLDPLDDVLGALIRGRKPSWIACCVSEYAPEMIACEAMIVAKVARKDAAFAMVVGAHDQDP